MSLPKLNPEVLIVARETRGLTQKQVAAYAKVNQGSISKAERGLLELSSDAMHRIAELLEYPLELFFEPGRIREVGSACLYHRKRKTLPVKVRSRTDSRMFIRNVNVVKLLDGLEFDQQRHFLTLDPDEYGGDASEVARELRGAWKLPDGPIPNLVRLIESAGGIVLLEDFGHHKLFGMSCWTVRGHPLFFLNSTISTADLRWTLAHELGHLTMHGILPEGDVEEQADAFAGELLAPARLFRPDARHLTFDRLFQLKAYWGLSLKGVIKRARVVGAISEAQAIRLYKQHSARGYNSREPDPLPPERPSLIDAAIKVHLEEHGYTLDELAFSTRLSTKEFRREFLNEPAVTS